MTERERIFVALAEIVGDALNEVEIAEIVERVVFHDLTADLVLDV